MEKRRQPRDEAYIKYLADLVDENLVESRPQLGKRDATTFPPRTAANRRIKWMYAAGGLLVIGLLALIVREVAWPRPSFQGDSEEFARLRQEVSAWSLSGLKSIATPMIKKRAATEAQWQTEDSEFLGDNRWRIWGTVQATDSSGGDWQSKWETQVSYSPETSSGEMLKVALDGTMIYSQ